eukprot:403342346
MFANLDLETHNKIVFKKHPLQSDDACPELPRKNCLRLLSYNMFLRPFVKNVENDWKDERLHAYVQLLDDFDIICNQEVFDFFNYSRKERLISHAMKAGFINYAVAPPAPFFSEYSLSGGLVTFSRFPILETSFKPYRYGVLSDQISYKGVLYCKIDVAGAILHIFQTHTQASYFGTSVEEFNITFECRLEQLRIIRMFIEEKTRNATSDELIILCGDINVNGAKVDRKGQVYRDMVKDKPEFKAVLDEYEREYDLLISILTNNNEDVAVDVMRQANSGVSPVTFGDCYIDEKGKEHPLETQLVKVEDHCTQQSLDYIFQIKRGFNVEKERLQIENQKTASGTHSNEPKSQNGKSKHKKLVVSIEESRIEKFFFDSHPVIKQCSDHYGVSTILKLV